MGISNNFPHILSKINLPSNYNGRILYRTQNSEQAADTPDFKSYSYTSGHNFQPSAPKRHWKHGIFRHLPTCHDITTYILHRTSFKNTYFSLLPQQIFWVEQLKTLDFPIILTLLKQIYRTMQNTFTDFYSSFPFYLYKISIKIGEAITEAMTSPWIN